MKRLLQIGIIMVLTISITACGRQAQAGTPAPTTAIETTASTVEETTEEPTTEDGEVIVSMGRYGEYGKEVYDVLVSMWLSYELEAEEDLREAASSLLGSISKENYEAIIAEILAMDRGQNPNANAVTQSQPAPTQSETKASVPTQSAPAETQASVQPTQPAPEEELAPGALTIEEIERREREAFGEPVSDPSSKVEIVDPKSITGGGDGSDFNWQ